MRTLHFLALAVVSATALSACNQDSSARPSASAIDQSNICEVNAWRHDVVASKCKPGQKVVFLPSSFGNEQLPVIFAAINCDLRYSIALTTGGVTCIYGPITPKPDEPQKQPSETPAK